MKPKADVPPRDTRWGRALAARVVSDTWTPDHPVATMGPGNSAPVWLTRDFAETTIREALGGTQRVVGDELARMDAGETIWGRRCWYWIGEDTRAMPSTQP